MADGRLRIGELSRRAGVSPQLLRAWESRYELVSPERTSGGLRLYSEHDEQRVRSMRRHISEGLSAAEAAQLAKREHAVRPESDLGTVAELKAALTRGLDTLDEPAAQRAFDRLFERLELRQALAEVIVPLLRRIGERWAANQTTVAEEHFASNIIEGRLRRLAQGWGDGVGPRAILACPPGELHELGLLAFGLALRERGWRIVYLGADTPVAAIADCLDQLAPEIVVLAALDARRFLESATALTELAARVRVAIGGAGASAALANDLGVDALTGDLFDVATNLIPARGDRG